MERAAKTLHRMSPRTPVSVPAKITWNIQYIKLVNGVIDRLKILIDGDGNEISSSFKISVVLHRALHAV